MGLFPEKVKSLINLLGGWKINSVAVTATAAELNKLAGATPTTAELNLLSGLSGPSADGLGLLRVARATYDFAEHGGAAGAIDLGVTLPDNAIIVGGFVDVVTTCTSAGADAGTMALSVLNANDIVSAIAISNGANPWDAGLHAIVPKANTPEATAIKLTAAKPVVATIATNDFTAGKFTVFLYYLMGD